ncbi:MAG: hypothetical protein R3F20_18410 [Planctomycetota bacterium]
MIDVEDGLRRAREVLLPREEDGRVDETLFLQRRLVFLVRTGIFLCLLSGVIVVGAGLDDGRSLGQRIRDISPTILPWSSAILFGAAGLALAWRRWNRGVLIGLDLLLLPAVVAQAAVNAAAGHGIASPVIVLLMAQAGLVFRAVVVPSTPARTLVVSAAAMAAVLAAVGVCAWRRDAGADLAPLSMPVSVFGAWIAAGLAPRP